MRGACMGVQFVPNGLVPTISLSHASEHARPPARSHACAHACVQSVPNAPTDSLYYVLIAGKYVHSHQVQERLNFLTFWLESNVQISRQQACADIYY